MTNGNAKSRSVLESRCDSSEVRGGTALTVAHGAQRQEAAAPREMRATAGWPPVAIPGRPGWYRHLIDGQQVDLPSRDPHQGDPYGK